MLVARITVTGSQIRAQKLMPITSGMVGARVEVSFDEAWEGFLKVFVWNHWNLTIDDMEASGTIPAEVLDRPGGWLRLGVYGTKDGRALPTAWVTLGSVESGADPSGDESANPALPVWAQLQAAMEELRRHAVTDDEIAAAVESYLQENPVEVPELPANIVQTVNGVAPDENGNVKIEVSESSGGCLLTVETVTVEDTVPVTGISLDHPSLSLTAGDTAQLTATVSPANATNPAVLWATSDASVASVAGGLVTAIAGGNATITARAAENSSIITSCVVTVTAEESGDDSGGEDSGSTSGEKIQFSTLELNNGSIKAGGDVASGASERYVTVPYTEGMFIKTLWNAGWSMTTYPAIQVVSGDVYETPAYNVLYQEDGVTKQTYSIGGKLPNIVEATLTGYAASSSVIVNMLIGNASTTDMDNSDCLYYIPGGES